MKLLPFNLERALAGDKVVTRDGGEVKQLTKFDVSNFAPVFGVVDGFVISWTTEGKHHIKSDSRFDLFMAPKTVKRWVNFYENDHACDHKNEESAKRFANPKAIAIAVPVEFEEGYGVDHE